MTNGIASETNGITRGTNGNDLLRCSHCGSVAEYVSEHAKGKRWAVACTMTSKVAADEGKPMCRCRTPFVRDKGQARDIWNRRAEDVKSEMAQRIQSLELECAKLAEELRKAGSRGECRMVTDEDCQNWMSCSVCDADYYNDQPLNYCPNCGRKVKQ